MGENTRHKRELDAALKQIKEIKKRAERSWRLDVPLGKLAVQGIGIFALAFLVGLGLGVLWKLLFTSF